jgi:hypothetical protein
VAIDLKENTTREVDSGRVPACQSPDPGVAVAGHLDLGADLDRSKEHKSDTAIFALDCAAAHGSARCLVRQQLAIVVR